MTYKVPTLAELYADDETAFKDDQFKQRLNSEPRAEWIKVHKSTGIPYMPIEIVEMLLDRIFVGRWKVSVLGVQVIVNAIQVTIRLEVFHPVLKEWLHYDGVGAMPIQLKSGAQPSDLSAINHNSIQMNTPAAKSYAIKDAAEHLGKIFGRDITRKNAMQYNPAFQQDPFIKLPVADMGKDVIAPPPPPLPEHLEKHVAPEHIPSAEPVVTQPAFTATLFDDPGMFGQATPAQPANIEIDF